MPHNASEYVVANVLPRTDLASPTLHALNYVDAALIGQILSKDAKDYLYFGIISFANACASLRMQYYSWSTVKLYYATFYMIRGLLANAGICICYMSTKPMIVKALAGERLRRPWIQHWLGAGLQASQSSNITDAFGLVVNERVNGLKCRPRASLLRVSPLLSSRLV